MRLSFRSQHFDLVILDAFAFNEIKHEVKRLQAVDRVRSVPTHDERRLPLQPHPRHIE